MSAVMRVSLAEENQIAEVCDIIRKGYVPLLLNGTIYESKRFDQYLAKRYRMGDLFLLGEVGDKADVIIGFAQVLLTGSTLHLNHLVVLDSARGQGVGARLLHEVAVLSDEKKLPVTLDVDSRNVGAINFYEKAGFHIEYRTPVTMIPRKSGSMPIGLLDSNDDYEKYDFCYVDCCFPPHEVRVGVVGNRTIRLLATDIPDGFQWKKFIKWAGWADVFVFGVVDIDVEIDILQKWEVFRMKQRYEIDNN